MKFDTKTHKVIIESLDGEEIDAYIDFLTGEIARHEGAIEDAYDCIVLCERDGYVRRKALIKLYESAIVRHQKDIKSSEECIKRARGLRK